MDTNAKFLSINDFNIYKSSAVFPSRIEFDTLTVKVNELITNVTAGADNKKETSHWGIGILCFIAIMLGIVSIFMTVKSNQSGGEE